MKSIQPKTAVITGATGGIGREISAWFLKSGISVYLLGRNFDDLRTSLNLYGGKENEKVHFCEVDLNDEDEIIETANLINKEEKIDFLIHGAAFYSHGAFEQSEISDLDRSYRVNVRAPYLLSRLLLPKLIPGNGIIVFINSSVVTGFGKKNLIHYASTKSAMKSMADCLRQEVNEKGVRVFTIILGKTATNMQKRACEYEGIPFEPQKMLQPGDIAKFVYHAVSVPHSMELTDLYIRPSVRYES